MDLGLKDKVALITGSSAGIGFTIAEKLAEEGCHLIICGRNSQRLEQAYQSLAQAYPVQEILRLVADVHQAQDSEQLIQDSLNQYGKIDILVNNSEGANFADLVKSGVVNAALMNFTKSVARQTAPYNVLINSVNPGVIDTPRHREYLEIYAKKQGTTPDLIREGILKTIPMNRIGTTEEFANLVVFLASECASYITGITIPIDGGLSSSAF